MYLLDTQALTDLVSGHDNAAREFVANAERRNLDVRVSVISFGALKAEIGEIKDPCEKENWGQRFEITLNHYRTNGKLLDVDRRISLEWALLKYMDLPTKDKNKQLGDDERLVVATALVERLVLVTSSPKLYQPTVDQRGLHVKGI